MPPLVQIVVILVLLALGLWVLSQFPALDPTIVKVIRVLVIVFAVLIALNALLVWIWGSGLFSRAVH